MTVEKKGLRVLDQNIAVLQVSFAFPQGFYLGADERHAGFDGFLNGIVMVSLSILTNELHQ